MALQAQDRVWGQGLVQQGLVMCVSVPGGSTVRFHAQVAIPAPLDRKRQDSFWPLVSRTFMRRIPQVGGQ